MRRVWLVALAAGCGRIGFDVEAPAFRIPLTIDAGVTLADFPVGDDTTPGYDFEIGTRTWRMDVGDGTTASYAAFGEQVAYDGAWTHLVGVADRGTELLSAYADGAMQNAIDISTIGSLDSAQVLELSGDDPFAGLLDELRIYDHALDADWIATEYRNLTDPTFLQVGAVIAVE